MLATPITYNQTGMRSFCSYEDAVVRWALNNGTAGRQ